MNDFREYIGYCDSIYNYVKHHGIKGQKWGVRNGPPYPIEDTVLKAGTKLEHVSKHYSGGNSQLLLDHYNSTKKMLYTYNPKDKWDKKVYQGPFAQYLKNSALLGQNRNPEVHKFTVKEDLKMPTKKQRVDAFMDIIKQQKKEYIKELEGVRDLRVKYGYEEYSKVDFKNLKTEEDVKTAYEIFNHAMEAAHQYKVTQAYCEYMCQHFDAMVDDNNVNVYNRAHDPIIILNTEKLLASKQVARQLSDFKMSKNFGDVVRELKKHGEAVKL